MSYSCYISFKTISQEELYAFFTKLKAKTTENAFEIIKDESCFSPLNKHYPFRAVPEDTLLSIFSETEDWICRLFTHKWFYKDGVLGVYGVHESLYDLFDTTIYFQNSCDHDYALEEWQAVPLFKQIADKWAGYSSAELTAAILQADCDLLEEECSEKQLEYWRRSMCYNEIWGLFKDTLYDDNSVVYLGLYSFCDTVPATGARMLLEYHNERWPGNTN